MNNCVRWEIEEAELYVRSCLERRDQMDAEWSVTTGAFFDLCREVNISVPQTDTT